jgi:hypothetical protein
MGIPDHAWVFATLGYVVLIGLTRLCTPRAANVNLAFSVASGWEKTFHSYPKYFALLVAAATATFFVAEIGLRKALA